MKKEIIALGLIIGFVSSLAYAADDAEKPRHRNRIAKQNKRIANGLSSGTLTIEEAKALKAEQRTLKAKIREMRTDGLTAAEKKQINNMQDVASSKIQVKKLNGETSDGASEERIRQFKQNQRIADGLAKGDLTKKEAKNLRKYIKSNAEVIKAANEDGVVTGEEEAFIEARQDLSSDRIYKQRHDEQSRAPASVGEVAGTEK